MWRTPAFLSLAAADAIAVACFYVALLYAPRYITGGEVALITLLEVVLGPLFGFRFGEIPSGWTVAGGALLLGTLAAHEACGLHSAAAETMRSPMRRAAPSPASPNEESSPIPYQPAEVRRVVTSSKDRHNVRGSHSSHDNRAVAAHHRGRRGDHAGLGRRQRGVRPPARRVRRPPTRDRRRRARGPTGGRR